MDRQTETQPTPVPLAKPVGDLRSRWSWVNPCAWTVRMLTALEPARPDGGRGPIVDRHPTTIVAVPMNRPGGVKGERWFTLYDKVFAERNLLSSYQQVAKNKGAAGIDHQTAEDWSEQLPEAIWELSDKLKAGTYVPSAIKRVHIPKPGTNETRPLGIPTVRDRIVQGAIVNVMEPIFERDLVGDERRTRAEHSYGFRPGRGCKDALRRVDKLVRQGHHFIVDADLKGYFDTIPHDRLLARLGEKIADNRVLSLVESFLKAPVQDGETRQTPSAGTPQGAVLSPLLSNIYLDPLDHLMAGLGFQMVRYADDFVILCRTADEAAQALDTVREWVVSNGLTLHPTKTKVVDVRVEGFDFLACLSLVANRHFRDQRHWPRDKATQKLKDTLRAKTTRTSGDSLSRIVANVNQTLVGWFEYFKHSRPWIFGRLDQWLRGRLRSILRRRQRKRGRGRGSDHQRWPTGFFVEQGLYSLKTAHASAVQSSRR